MPRVRKGLPRRSVEAVANRVDRVTGGLGRPRTQRGIVVVAVMLVAVDVDLMADVATSLDLTPSGLSAWFEQARADRAKGKTGQTTEEKQALALPRKENPDLRFGREFQEKAAVRLLRIARSTGVWTSLTGA